MKLSVVAVACCLWAQVSVAGQAPERSALPFARTVWHTSDGLPEDIVQSVAEARDGSLWIGTTGGISRFDGLHIQPISVPSASLNVKSIFCLGATRDGGIWAGTEGGGLLQIRDGQIAPYPGQERFASTYVRAIFEDSRGNLWAATDTGLLKRPRGSASFVTVDLGAPSGAHALTESSDGTVWAGGTVLVSISPDGQTHHFLPPGIPGENRIKSLLSANDGSLLVGTVQGLQILRDGKFHVLPDIHVTVRSLLRAHDGTIWIGTLGEGIWLFRDGKLSRMKTGNLLASQTILSLLEDENEQIWVGTQAGLVRLERSVVEMVPIPADSDSDYQTISMDKNGNIWLVSDKAFLIQGGKVKPVHFDALGALAVRNVYPAHDGALWLGTEGGGVFRLKGQEVKHYVAPNELPNNFVRGFMEAHDGSMWVLTGGGVGRIHGDSFEIYNASHGLPFNGARAIAEDHNGAVWIGTDRGVALWSNGSMQKASVIDRLATEKVWSILEDRHHVLWFATRDHGLFRMQPGGELQQFTKADGLPTDSFYQILQDPRGRLWFSGANVIATAEEKEMDEHVPTPDRPLAIHVLRMPAGAEAIQIYGGRQPSGLIAKDGTVWFPTNRGAAHVVATPQESTASPLLALTAADIDGVSKAAAGNDLRLPSHVDRLNLHYSVVYLLPRERLHVRYLLENFDHKWIDGDLTQTATYTNLPPGRYRFRLQAIDQANPDRVKEVSFGIEKSRSLYQRWWFYMLLLMAAGFCVWLSHRMRLRHIRSRFQAVLAERSRVAREMHDTLIQGCIGISALLEGAGPGEDSGSERERLLGLARAQVLRTIAETRNAIWNLRHEGENQIDLVAAVRRLAEEGSTELGHDVNVSSSVPSLPLEASVGHELMMVVREAMYNSLRHSGADGIALDIQMQGSTLSISIRDQGHGFDMQPADKHFGILGMAERMRRLGGRFHVDTTVGKGTAVYCSLRYNRVARNGLVQL